MPPAAVVVDPQEVVELAQALQVRADAVGAIRDTLIQRLGQATWSGPAASRFRVNAEQLNDRLAVDADDLRRLTLALRRTAEALAEELSELRSIEDQVRAWLAAHPGAPAPWPQSSLPSPGDPSWREVQRAFAAAGIPITPSPVSATTVPEVSVQAPVGVQAGDWKATLSPAEAWIIQHESGFDPNARNPSSGAFGIWQGLGSTLDNYARRFGYDKHTTDPLQQLTMFRAYVKDRYGTAEKAMAFWQRHHWY